MLRRLATALFALTQVLFAQDVRDLSTPVAHLELLGVSSSTIANQVLSGYRLVDIEYRGTSLLGTTYDAVFVQNSGAYSTGWWWYTGLTATQVSLNLATNNARLIDLEPYDDGNGNVRFACIMVDNTGANNKAWWWYYNTTTSSLVTQTNANNARLVDLDTYTIGATTYYSGVMIANTGADYRQWWWYLNATGAQIGNYINTNNARLYDLERRSNGNFDCVMVRDPASPAWYWWYDLTSTDVSFLIGNYGVRPIDIESYLVSGSRRYAMVTINNSNALTTSVGALMRATTDGKVGCWMERINGSNVANLNGDAVFEPASTMKTLHHVHAMRRVYLNAVALTQLINVYTNYSPSNLSCPVDTGPVQQALQDVLRDMMESSDNARTQAVTAYFGESNINNTAAALGMASTSLNHRLGCASGATSNPNQITLRDLHTLHEAVVNGYVGGYRDTFYDLMLQSLNGLAIDTVINTEAAALSLPLATATNFRNFTKMAHKGGNYSLINGGPWYYHRAEFGWISLPFISNGALAPREYSFGAFVNNASVDANAANAIYQNAIPELLRPTIRQALQTWANNLAGVQSFGAGCGFNTPHSHSVTGLPRIGANPLYVTDNGYPNSLEVLGIGFSSTVWNSIPLPASLSSFGSFFGCQAFTDIAISRVGVSDASGHASFGIGIPNATAFLGFEFLTQGYSFSPTALFKTTNAMRSIVGL
ncbi:MAG: serine hydrolase [Planctomycetes bacterium]|nr:serine hydrolase [Planctomycetota bacterium]MCB9884497.1 serine hydrolase [Planctomycetota bacterium]